VDIDTVEVTVDGQKGGLSMSRALKITFLIHAVVAFAVGALLVIIPGRLLWRFGWDIWGCIDPLITRVAGAALVALAWTSFRGWRATERTQVAVLIEMEAAFFTLTSLGWLYKLVTSEWPYHLRVWIVFVILVLFSIAWIILLVREKRR
jgi:hypothetical protein